MKFNKYMKLRNHYDTRSLRWWLTWNPGLRDAKFVATEKLHGANFSVWVYPDGEVRYGKRSGFLSEDSKFFRWKEAVEAPLFQGWLEDFKVGVAGLGRPLVLYGELFGAGVQKEVDYGPAQQVRFFDIYDVERNEYWAPRDVFNAILESLRVPHVGFYHGVDEAMAANDTFPSLLNPVAGNICEGIVVRPWNKTYATEVGDRFVIKKKNDKFKEKAKVPRTSKASKEMPHEVLAALNLITPYITEQRLSNVISHEGEPEGMKDFGPLLRKFVCDVRDEVAQEHPHAEDDLDKKGRSTVWKSVGSHCATLLRAYIFNGGG